MPRQDANPESKRRGVVIAKMRRLHGSIDNLRCDEFVVNEGLDEPFDRMLRELDDVMERVPPVTRIFEVAA